jgi:hypothetical protein
MDAISVLKKDHRNVKKSFAEFNRTTTRAAKKRKKLFDEIKHESVLLSLRFIESLS